MYVCVNDDVLDFINNDIVDVLYNTHTQFINRREYETKNIFKKNELNKQTNK